MKHKTDLGNNAHMKIAHSWQQDVPTAVGEIKHGFEGESSRAILYFCSSQYDPTEMARSMQAAFPGNLVFGCTTSGELSSGKMTDHSIVAMALPESIVQDASVQVVQNLSDGPERSMDEILPIFQSHFGSPLSSLSPEQFVGIVLMDGLSGAEERIMDRLGDLTDITFVGGSAGDDLKFKQTFVFANGTAYANAALLIVIKSGVPFEVIKTQSFRPTDKVLTATKVNNATREVLEFDSRPAAEVYAEAVGLPKDRAFEAFMNHPVGLMVEGEPYVRSPRQIQGDSMYFFCNVVEGMSLTVLEGQDIVKDTRAAVDACADRLGGLSGLLNFHCILRSLQLKSEHRTAEYAEIFEGYPMIGLSTYGEAYIGHINQTATMLAFQSLDKAA